MMRTFNYCIILLLMVAEPSWARIKLVALPQREATVVRLDNPQATLLEEERVLTLQKGLNQVDFSWKGVHIQADSIRLTVLEAPQAVTLLNISYPPNEQALVWEIGSPSGQQIRVRISYLLNNIDRLVTYQAHVNQAESHLALTAFVVLRNFSGEDLPQSQFQLDHGETLTTPILSGETKRLQFFTVAAVPITKQLVFDAAELPWDPKAFGDNVGIPVYYESENTPEHHLGEHALWDGKARLYSEYGHSDTQKSADFIFLGEDNLEFTPVGQELKVRIGESRDVVVTQRKINERRLNERRNYKRNQVILYDTEETIQVEIENFKEQLALVTLKESMPEEWEMVKHSHPYETEHNRQIKFEALEVAPKEKIVVTYTYNRRHIRP